MMRKKRVWIFDLDDTLHNASAHIFPAMNRAMTQYIMQHLALNEQDAQQLRANYWRIYGATLKGLMRIHGIDAQHFLATTHHFENLAQMLVQVKSLKHVLNNLAGQKYVFTNAPQSYAVSVLKLMGIEQCFAQLFSIESTKFHGKPSMRGFQAVLKLMQVNPSDCVMVEDNLATLKTAKCLGMRTILVSQNVKNYQFVDFRINSVLALTHLRL